MISFLDCIILLLINVAALLIAMLIKELISAKIQLRLHQQKIDLIYLSISTKLVEVFKAFKERGQNEV